MHWPLQLLRHLTSSLEWPRHRVPLNAGAGFVQFLDRVLNPPQASEHPVYGVHSDQLPCTGSGSAKERDLGLSIILLWWWWWGGGWVRREKIWDLRFAFPSLSSLPKQLRRYTHAFYSLRLTRVKFVYSWFNKVCSGKLLVGGSLNQIIALFHIPNAQLPMINLLPKQPFLI